MYGEFSDKPGCDEPDCFVADNMTVKFCCHRYCPLHGERCNPCDAYERNEYTRTGDTYNATLAETAKLYDKAEKEAAASRAHGTTINIVVEAPSLEIDDDGGEQAVVVVVDSAAGEEEPLPEIAVTVREEQLKRLEATRIRFK